MPDSGQRPPSRKGRRAYTPSPITCSIGLVLHADDRVALRRRIHRAYTRVREGNFALEGLLEFDLPTGPDYPRNHLWR